MPFAPPSACLEQPCPRPAVDRGRCAIHARSTTQRGYGTDHQADRLSLEATLPALCWYGCGQLMARGSDWVAAHIRDGDRSSDRVVSCRSCNERAKVPGRAALFA